MANKKNKGLLVAIAALSMGTILASCNVDAGLKPEEKNEQIINLEGVVNNTQEYIYDALVKAGDSNSEKVLQQILGKIAEDQFGEFYELKEVIGDDTALGQYARNHAAYVNAADPAAKAKIFYNSLLTQIQKAFFDVANNSSYITRSTFEEEKFAKAQKADLYDIKIDATFKKVKKDGSDTYKDVDKYFHTGWLDDYKDYIVRSILPNQMRKQLIVEYLHNNNYGTLGRSYARKVQYISLPQNGTYKDKVLRLAREYAKQVMAANEATYATLPDSVKDLSFLDKLYKGYTADLDTVEMTIANSIYDAAGFASKTFGTINYRVETLYGEKLDEYQKITDDRFTNDSSAYSTFTGSGAYTKEVGLQIQTNEIVSKTEVKEGWYTSSGLSDLPSTAKTNLFKIAVANEVDHPEKVKDATYTEYLNGKYYLNKNVSDPSDPEDLPYVINDIDSGTTYIVRIEEAVNSSKLVDADRDTSYNKIHDSNYREQIAYDVAYLLADNETYKKSANQYYIEKAALSYHDDAVYSYFKTTFPDLFD
ncbi:MAG: hypothetical protein MJ239_00885 [Bacilli bacterium]|nr:hypothetical protein [Bacilli bacterium]